MDQLSLTRWRRATSVSVCFAHIYLRALENIFKMCERKIRQIKNASRGAKGDQLQDTLQGEWQKYPESSLNKRKFLQ